MATFRYTAKSRDGARQEGTLDAADKRAAMTLLTRRGLVPITIRDDAGGGAGPAAPAPAASSSPSSPSAKAPSKLPAKAPSKPLPASLRGRRPPAAKTKSAASTASSTSGTSLFTFGSAPRRPKMKLKELQLFTRELTDLLTSGMTLGNALHSLSTRKTGKAQDAIVTALRDDIVAGASLSSALAKYPESFPTLYVSMVRAGEASGQLPSVLERLVGHYDRVLAAREKVGMALVYPCIVAVIGFGAMIFMMVFVIPTFSQMFEDLGGQLPLPTRVLIGISAAFVKYGWAIAGGIALLVWLIRRALRTPAGIDWKDRVALRLPAIGNIVKANAFANFAHTLGTLLANGVQVLQALSIVEDTVGNVHIAHAIRDARDKVTDGSSISRPLAQNGVFPRLLTDMLAIGEESGDITGALDHIGLRYDAELDRAVKVFTTILEPVMMLFIAAGVGFVAISMLMAVFELTSGLQA